MNPDTSASSAPPDTAWLRFLSPSQQRLLRNLNQEFLKAGEDWATSPEPQALPERASSLLAFGHRGLLALAALLFAVTCESARPEVETALDRLETDPSSLLDIGEAVTHLEVTDFLAGS